MFMDFCIINTDIPFDEITFNYVFVTVNKISKGTRIKYLRFIFAWLNPYVSYLINRLRSVMFGLRLRRNLTSQASNVLFTFLYTSLLYSMA